MIVILIITVFIDGQSYHDDNYIVSNIYSAYANIYSIYRQYLKSPV